jgi:hypothetical protein
MAAGQSGLKPYWGKPAVRNFREEEGTVTHGLASICHEARKGGYNGSRWPKHGAPAFYSTCGVVLVRAVFWPWCGGGLGGGWRESIFSSGTSGDILGHPAGGAASAEVERLTTLGLLLGGYCSRQVRVGTSILPINCDVARMEGDFWGWRNGGGEFSKEFEKDFFGMCGLRN